MNTLTIEKAKQGLVAARNHLLDVEVKKYALPDDKAVSYKELWRKVWLNEELRAELIDVSRRDIDMCIEAAPEIIRITNVITDTMQEIKRYQANG